MTSSTSAELPSQEPVAGPAKGLVSQAISARIAAGELDDDPHQHAIIATLDSILAELHTPKLANKQSALGWMFGKRNKAVSYVPKGMYLHGGVGRGKTMLMDLFFELADVEQKRRVHFHAFMREVHGQIHQWRQKQKSAKDKSADPIPPLAEKLAGQMSLLCFDEFAVTDVADAMILGRLFTHLFDHGVTVMATSNVAPDDLYKHGLNRSFFLPFIELVKERLYVLELASETDYRLQKLIESDVYFSGINSADRFEDLWLSMTEGLVVEEAVLEVSGRQLNFAQSAGGILRASFDELCKRPLGAYDYLAITERFHTLFLSDIPVLDISDRNAVKRLIALIDTLYDAGRVLIVEAATPPHRLYEVDHGTEAFEFQRTVSRLTEMQSAEWLSGREPRD